MSKEPRGVDHKVSPVSAKTPEEDVGSVIDSDRKEQEDVDKLMKDRFDEDVVAGKDLRKYRRIGESVLSEGRIKFDTLGLGDELADGIAGIGWDVMSEVQYQSIPAIFEGSNVVVRSKNGTGKTGSYLVPMLGMIDTSVQTLQALVLLPTKELAFQTYNVASKLGKFIGGLSLMRLTPRDDTSFYNDADELKKGVNIVFATVGYLLRSMRHIPGLLNDLKIICLDEAHQLLGPQFCEQVEIVLSEIPKKCQRIFFSATYPANVKDVIIRHMEDPVFIDPYTTGDGSDAGSSPMLKSVKQMYLRTDDPLKIVAFRLIAQKLSITKCIIYCMSIRRVNRVRAILADSNFNVISIHGAMTETERTRSLELFREKPDIKFLVSTDITALGIDIPSVNVVIHFDMCPSQYTYIHRVGRAGRFGQVGLSVLFVTTEEGDAFRRLQDAIHMKIEPFKKDISPQLYA